MKTLKTLLLITLLAPVLAFAVPVSLEKVGTYEYLRYLGDSFGIGTTTPTYKLTVGGDINFTGNLYQNGILFTSGGGGATTTINGFSGPTFTFATSSATGIGLNITGSGSTITFSPTVSTTTLASSINYWSLLGDNVYRLNGNVGVGTTTPSQALTLLSTFAGGENTFDSTKRIQLNSFQRAEDPNNFGEVIRINADASSSKQMIAWYDNFTTPGTPELKAWIGWHYRANDVSDPLFIHDHISIETNDAAGLIRTRLAVDARNQDTTDVYTTNSNFTVNQGVSGVTGLNGQSKSFSIYAASSTSPLSRTLRWAFQGNSTSESGSNVGSDFQISSFADNGGFISTPFFIKRSSGDVGVGTTSPAAKLDVQQSSNLNGILVRNNGASNTAANILSQANTTGSRIFQGGLTSDSISRFSVEASGLIEWGAGGGTGRDTNLYRNSANFLRTDDSFIVPQLAVGGVTSPSAVIDVASSTDPVRDLAQASNYPLVLRNTSTNTGSSTGIGFHVSSGSGVTGFINYIRRGASSFGDLIFGTTPSGGVPTERMRILSDGSIGIATSTPFKALTVQGEIFSTATTTAGGLQVSAPATATSTAYIYSKQAGFGGAIILEDTGGGACTMITTSAGSINSVVVTCPTEI